MDHLHADMFDLHDCSHYEWKSLQVSGIRRASSQIHLPQMGSRKEHSFNSSKQQLLHLLFAPQCFDPLGSDNSAGDNQVDLLNSSAGGL